MDPLDAKLSLLVILVIADSQYIALLRSWSARRMPGGTMPSGARRPMVYPPALSAASGSPTAGPQTTCELHESACAGKIQTSSRKVKAEEIAFEYGIYDVQDPTPDLPADFAEREWKKSRACCPEPSGRSIAAYPAPPNGRPP